MLDPGGYYNAAAAKINTEIATSVSPMTRGRQGLPRRCACQGNHIERANVTSQATATKGETQDGVAESSAAVRPRTCETTEITKKRRFPRCRKIVFT